MFVDHLFIWRVVNFYLWNLFFGTTLVDSDLLELTNVDISLLLILVCNFCLKLRNRWNLLGTVIEFCDELIDLSLDVGISLHAIRCFENSRAVGLSLIILTLRVNENLIMFKLFGGCAPKRWLDIRFYQAQVLAAGGGLLVVRIVLFDLVQGGSLARLELKGRSLVL